MPKSLTKLWLRGLKRLVATQIAPPRAPKTRAPAQPVRAKAKAAKPSAAKPKVSAKPRLTRESRVRPRASAWAAGKWSRSFHSAPPVAGRFVNHLAYALYLPTGASLTDMPLVVMMHGCQQSAEEFAQGTRIHAHYLALYINAVICSEMSPMRNTITDALKSKTLMLVRRCAVTKV